MVYVNDTACNGCGACVDICPSGALIIQNHCAFIDQELCRGCELCLDACPMGAILSGEKLPAPPEVIHMPEIVPAPLPSQVETVEQVGLRDMVLPAIGSLLLWTGRELVPRLADAVLGYLDRKTQSSPAPQELGVRGAGPASNPASRYGRGQRRQRRRRNRRFF